MSERSRVRSPYGTPVTLAQLVERKTFNLVVVGSSPTEGTYYFLKLGNVPERSKGSDLSSDAIMLRGFESHRYHIFIYLFIIYPRSSIG